MTRRHVLVVVVVVVAVAGMVGSRPAWAAWTDQVPISGTSLTAHGVAPPDAVNCGSAGLTATMTWSEKDPRYNYEVLLKRADGSVVSTSQVTGAAVSRAFTAPDDFGFDSALTVNAFDFTVEVRSYLADTPAWRSAGSTLATQEIRVTVAMIVFPVVVSVTCV